MTRLWRDRGRAIGASGPAGSLREPVVDRHGRGRTSAPARLGMHAQLSRSCENPEDPDAEPAKQARRSASTAFVEHYNHRRAHESLEDLTPADVYFGRGQAILIERERIKRHTI